VQIGHATSHKAVFSPPACPAVLKLLFSPRDQKSRDKDFVEMAFRVGSLMKVGIAKYTTSNSGLRTKSTVFQENVEERSQCNDAADFAQRI
jgi:hypothetical protein